MPEVLKHIKTLTLCSLFCVCVSPVMANTSQCSFSVYIACYSPISNIYPNPSFLSVPCAIEQSYMDSG